MWENDFCLPIKVGMHTAENLFKIGVWIQIGSSYHSRCASHKSCRQNLMHEKWGQSMVNGFDIKSDAI